jgi:S-adenosylmethionine:tRNA ribosyltransferase-isomerase
MYSVDQFDFELPPAQIAQHPILQRTASRLLHVNAAELSNLDFIQLPQLLNAGDLLVFNDTKVIRARFFGQKESGGQVEILLERILSPTHAVAQIRASKSPKLGTRITVSNIFEVEVLGRDGGFFSLKLVRQDLDFWQLAENFGSLPLPPYITHAAGEIDEQRYQTVFAREPGAVAAPTAGLHFDAALLASLKEMGVDTAFLTLHVGAGTFQPVRVQNIAEHKMHKERYDIPQITIDKIQRTKAAGGRVVAVGTTSLRALESGACNSKLVSGAAETEIFITPGYQFQVVDRLITNFHLPRSTLLMLVSAFAGLSTIQAAYAHAVKNGYRFFSYGDAMLLEKSMSQNL